MAVIPLIAETLVCTKRKSLFLNNISILANTNILKPI